MEAALQETEKSYRESGDLLYEIACNWIYQENLALKAAAKLAEIDREAAERAAIDQAARERFTAARQAATSATEQAQRVGSVPRKAGPAKRRKRK